MDPRHAVESVMAATAVRFSDESVLRSFLLLIPAAGNYCCNLANMAGASTTAMRFGGAFADSESDDDRLSQLARA